MIKSWNPINKQHVARVISMLVDDRNDVPLYIQCFLVDRLLWASTEYSDEGKWQKYFGTPYWSRGAIETTVANAAAEGIKLDKDLVHEHSVPKCVLAERIDVLWKEKRITEADIHDLLARFSHAAVISRNEDGEINKCGLRNRMPEDFSFAETDDVFGRYHVAELEIFKLETHDLELLSKGRFPSEEVSRLFSRGV